MVGPVTPVETVSKYVDDEVFAELSHSCWFDVEAFSLSKYASNYVGV